MCNTKKRVNINLPNSNNELTYLDKLSASSACSVSLEIFLYWIRNNNKSKWYQFSVKFTESPSIYDIAKNITKISTDNISKL
jgi:hypothetical protein